MVQLTGNSLSKRHQELNIKVIEAAKSKVNFDEVQATPESSDVDRLFKIDLAANYKHIVYIIETLKSGDALYISRALKKAVWLYDDEYSNVINTDYLHDNVYPFMSNKMKKKLLTSVSHHLKNKVRATSFYEYCKRENINDLAIKFLINTPEAFKLKLIEEKDSLVFNNEVETFRKSFLENSFEIFEAYLKQGDWSNVNNILCECSYFYTISDTKYLDLLEKYAEINNYTKFNLGLRISKDIVTKHKNRILENPFLYVNILNIKKLLRHSNSDDAKLYAIGMLPEKSSEFWGINFYKKYKLILLAITENERYVFVKKIFTEKYSNAEFEMTEEFYNQDYFELMTRAEKEEWALRHIAANQEMLGQGRDYIWYKFVTFEKSFPKVKTMIMTATDQSKRIELLKVLAQSAKSYRELETLFKYYYERHVNEKRCNTETFLRKVTSVHNVFEFDDNCWKVLDKIFQSIEVYNMIDIQGDPDFKIISILYHIVNKKEMPNALIKYMESKISVYSVKRFLNMFDEGSQKELYTFIQDFYLQRIQNFVIAGCDDDSCITQVHFALEFMAMFKKTKEDIPEAIMTIVNRNPKAFRYQQILQDKQTKNDVSDEDLIRSLKNDSKIVAEKIPLVRMQIIKDKWQFRINRFLRKLKIYFAGDVVTQQYLKMFHDFIKDEEYGISIASIVVNAIFQLSDEKSKIEFMNKYAPTDPKIDYSKGFDILLYTREAICRFACYSRPPVPLANILMYLKGDYVKFCIPMFHMYLANLPLPQCLKFVESLLDAPVSVQKHGLRLAFKCFSTDSLKKLVQHAWGRTKNVSLRKVIYKAFHEKTVSEQDLEMFETLKMLTLDLHSEDDEEIFDLITSKNLTLRGCEGDFMEAVWATVDKFNYSEQNVSRKVAVLKLMNEGMHLMKKDAITKIVTEHINQLFSSNEAQTLDIAKKLVPLNLGKWDLLAHYIVYFTNTEEDRAESVKITKFILGKCIEGWNEVASDQYVFRRIYTDFVENLKKTRWVPHPNHEPAVLPDARSYVNSYVIFEAILDDLQKALPLHEIYLFVWDLRISLIGRQVVKEMRLKYENEKRVEIIKESGVEYGKQLGKLIKEFVGANTYFSSFRDEIASIIKESAYDIESHLRYDEITDIKRNQTLVSIVRGLLDSESVEANLLAMQILPSEPECNPELYRSVYNSIQHLTDIESKCCFHHRFGQFKKRRIE